MKSKKFEKLDIIIDNPNSWMWEYIDKLKDTLYNFSKSIRVFKNSLEIENGDILFILSCDRILKSEELLKHKNNIVIHESNLPKGKGWSPMSYQVEEGLNKIPITLFEADQKLDSGDWYLKSIVELDGTELIDNIRKKQALKSFDLINEYLLKYPLDGNRQKGVETHYCKRTIKNQELDINKSIDKQFDLLRVCDNNSYPAYFFRNGKKYILKIEEDYND
jgi:methionyl-tRNA formyltransferase